MSSCSKANGGDLPTDVLYEIFIRLPLKSAFKFRCVSKLWNSLLSNPSLVHKVFSITTTSSPWAMVCYNRFDSPQLFRTHSSNLHYSFINGHDGFSFKFLVDDDLHPFNDNKVYLLASSLNGLVLYRIGNPHSLFKVCNPLTKQCVSLPPRPRQNSLDWDFVNLVSDSSTENDYKVVCSKYYSASHTTTIDMFPSDTGEWKMYKVHNEKGYHPARFHRPMVIRSGVLYWVHDLYNDSYTKKYGDSDYKMGIRAWNLENRELPKNALWFIDLPEEIRRPGGFFGVSEGNIYYGDTVNRRPGFLSVWMLEDYSNGGWVWQSVHNNIELKGYKKSGDLYGIHRYFNPEERNVIIFAERCVSVAYNTNTLTYEVLRSSPIPPSFVISRAFEPPLLITPKPTRIPLVLPPSGFDNTEANKTSFTVLRQIHYHTNDLSAA